MPSAKCLEMFKYVVQVTIIFLINFGGKHDRNLFSPAYFIYICNTNRVLWCEMEQDV